MSEAQIGRPSVYTQEVADLICARISEGESLRTICKDDALPTRSTVHLWVVQDREGFSDQYARARQAQAYKWAEDILDIADDGLNDTYVDENGKARIDFDVIQRSRLRVDTRKWLLSKVLPKIYGDKLAVVGGAPSDSPVEFKVTREVVPAAPNRLASYVNGNGNGANGHKP